MTKYTVTLTKEEREKLETLISGLTDTITGTPSGRVFFHSNNLANAGTLSPKVINASCKNMSLGLRS